MKIESIVVDGSNQGEKYLVHINDLPVPLTRKSFMYFTRLAWFRQQENGWTWKEDLEQGFNQARYLYRMKNEIWGALGEKDWPVIENNRPGYYRLDAPPGVISFNIDLLKQHDHYQVRELFNKE